MALATKVVAGGDGVSAPGDFVCRYPLCSRCQVSMTARA
jgi:hypothetical protein